MEKVIKFLQEILNEEITFENDSKLICEKFDIMVCIDDINLIKESIDSKPNENLALINSNNYEVAVKIESWRKMPISLMLGNNGYLEMRENSAGIVYSISPLSLEYIYFLISNIVDLNLTKYFRRRYVPIISRLHQELTSIGKNNMEVIDADCDEIEDLNKPYEKDLFKLEDLLNRLFRMIYSVKITSTKSRSIKEFSTYFDSVLFHVAFNLDLPIIKIKSIEELIEYELRIRLNRRDRELDPPRKTYNSDLVYHYQMGVSSGIPYMEYISYYHVIEHFMDKIFHEDFVNQIRRKLTDPGFSYNRDKDIKQLIKVMGDRIKIQKGEVRFDEKEALKLTLKKYLDIENLKTSISEFSEPLLEYY